MGRLRRLDSEMVRRQLAPSRVRAAQLIKSGSVRVNGQAAGKPARQIDPAWPIVVEEAEADSYASRGAHKLAGALAALGPDAPRIDGATCLDAGASTGGFTDVLLRHGAALVYAVDVGYGQLAWALASDPRVDVRDRTNVRNLQPSDFDRPIQVVVSDLSFISLTVVLPALAGLGAGDYVLMVKPQFEVGRERLPKGGVVRDPLAHAYACERVARCAQQLGLAVRAVHPSPLPGAAGNVEYFLHLRPGPAIDDESLGRLIAAAVAARPREDGADE